ncbi:Glucose-6-phosphate 1-dehydrogenase [Plasmodiophora brassicae]|uniref:Glucose-6-phosphate 1-dehydrogenase n=1 Tax=Plasmodiophora brassicae TaxID=37360 RepID=A0A0G4ISI3_PLABS|nr:hypothetical protein PBRA_006281 [Plasmodiophora brassicae]SPQ96013.1 unnamed protein product [Plasmodiophora brassicae]
MAGDGDDSDLRGELERLRRENDDLKRILYSQGTGSDMAAGSGQEADAPRDDAHLSIIVIGASGDLAKKKTYPALLALYNAKLLPSNVDVIGYARTSISAADFRSHITSKRVPEADQQEFLARCTYQRGSYDDASAFTELSEFCSKLEHGFRHANRLFYFAIPPNVFVTSARNIRLSCMSTTGWNRIVVEKPFGSDFASAAKLGASLRQYFTEEHLFRIDHYLGKEMVQNLSTLRFANSIFEPVWNRDHIELVMITFKENIGTAGRGGYFDKFGIIRDVMQNHLTQILSLVAMEQPVSLNAEDVRNEKVKVLRCIAPVTLDNLVVGQYTGHGGTPGYLDDPGVPPESLTPTYAMAVVFIKNNRWDGVPFILKCGKALDANKTEIRIQFRKPPGDLYHHMEAAPNELVVRVQPDEAIYMKMNTKEPGLTFEKLHHTELDLTYKKRFDHIRAGLPDAYERLILDVVRGDRSLFVRDDELLAAWSIFTPTLARLERDRIPPIPYRFGSRGPPQADQLAARLGFKRNVGYKYNVTH